MTIKECFEQIGSDYDSVLQRLGSENILKKFVIKFIDDPSFNSLKEGIAENDGEKAFRAAHTLKGICLNLGFDNLYKASYEITEQLRGREVAGCEEMFAKVEEQYNILIDLIKKLD